MSRPSPLEGRWSFLDAWGRSSRAAALVSCQPDLTLADPQRGQGERAAFPEEIAGLAGSCGSPGGSPALHPRGRSRGSRQQNIVIRR